MCAPPEKPRARPVDVSRGLRWTIVVDGLITLARVLFIGGGVAMFNSAVVPGLIAVSLSCVVRTVGLWVAAHAPAQPS